MTPRGLDIPKNEEEPPYTRMVAAKLVGVTAQTLIFYKKHGFVSPRHDGKNWLYSENDVKWLCCLRELIHVDKLSIGALKKLLAYAPCWEIKKCPGDERARCLRSGDGRLPGAFSVTTAKESSLDTALELQHAPRDQCINIAQIRKFA